MGPAERLSIDKPVSFHVLWTLHAAAVFLIIFRLQGNIRSTKRSRLQRKQKGMQLCCNIVVHVLLAIAECMDNLAFKEAFTYIDKVLEDHREFESFLAQQEEKRQRSFKAVEAMKRHPFFPDFCAHVGANPEAWGQETGDPEAEYEIFQEWLLAAEQDRGHVQVAGMNAI